MFRMLLRVTRKITLTTIELPNTVCPQLVGAAGASPYSKGYPPKNAISLAIREPASERRRTAFQSCCPPRGLPASPGGHHNEDADIGPARICVSRDACTRGCSPNGIDADHLHLRKPVPNPPG